MFSRLLFASSLVAVLGTTAKATNLPELHTTTCSLFQNITDINPQRFDDRDLLVIELDSVVLKPYRGKVVPKDEGVSAFFAALKEHNPAVMFWAPNYQSYHEQTKAAIESSEMKLCLLLDGMQPGNGIDSYKTWVNDGVFYSQGGGFGASEKDIKTIQQKLADMGKSPSRIFYFGKFDGCVRPLLSARWSVPFELIYRFSAKSRHSKEAISVILRADKRLAWLLDKDHSVIKNNLARNPELLCKDLVAVRQAKVTEENKGKRGLSLYNALEALDLTDLLAEAFTERANYDLFARIFVHLEECVNGKGSFSRYLSQWIPILYPYYRAITKQDPSAWGDVIVLANNIIYKDTVRDERLEILLAIAELGLDAKNRFEAQQEMAGQPNLGQPLMRTHLFAGTPLASSGSVREIKGAFYDLARNCFYLNKSVVDELGVWFQKKNGTRIPFVPHQLYTALNYLRGLTAEQQDRAADIINALSSNWEKTCTGQLLSRCDWVFEVRNKVEQPWVPIMQTILSGNYKDLADIKNLLVTTNILTFINYHGEKNIKDKNLPDAYYNEQILQSLVKHTDPKQLSIIVEVMPQLLATVCMRGADFVDLRFLIERAIPLLAQLKDREHCLAFAQAVNDAVYAYGHEKSLPTCHIMTDHFKCSLGQLKELAKLWQQLAPRLAKGNRDSRDFSELMTLLQQKSPDLLAKLREQVEAKWRASMTLMDVCILCQNTK